MSHPATTGADTVRVAAVDLGATSGRVMAAEVGRDLLHLTEVHRFPNGGVPVGDSVHWDVLGLYRETLAGLRAVAGSGPLDGIGIDSWAVDYGLLDRDGVLLGNPYSHRDRRTDGVAEGVVEKLGAGRLYETTGLQQLPFNTLFQLVASQGTAALESAQTLLLLPDLLAYWLTGEIGAERTNASTTQLYDVRRRAWATDLARDAGLPWSILPPLRSAGDLIGPVLPAVAAELSVPPTTPVIAVGSHDTASAVVGVPLGAQPAAYISSGTWSLVGLELVEPVLTEEARLADFTNEGGVDGTVRFLKNVMGLWVLSECQRAWTDADPRAPDLPTLLARAAEAPGLRTVVDIDDPRLLARGSALDPMPQRLAGIIGESGEAVPGDRAGLVRCILDSLALAYRRHLRRASELAGHPIEVVHVVGGGARNALLCQLTADACGVPVLAGPAEAAALGNVLVQARTLGLPFPDLGAMREQIRRTHELRRYEPRPGGRWEQCESRLGSR